MASGRRMRVIAWRPLRAFAEDHPNALVPLRTWRKIIESREYPDPSALKSVFGKRVDFLPKGVVVFDVGGNKYRITANVRYGIQCTYVRRVMTHAEYDTANQDGTL